MNTIEVQFLWLIAFFPLFGAFINGALTISSVVRKKSPNRLLINLIACLMPGLSFVVVCLGYFTLKSSGGTGLSQELYTWMSVGNFHVSIAFLFDLVF